jgi:Poly-beta-hydroxybutyrate polymerase (PhaC) N-terminus
MAASDAVVGRRRLRRDDCHILQGEKAMTRSGPSAEAQGYLESLMRAGQDAMKQFDHALVSAAGVGTKESLSSSKQFFPFALVADLQREYFKQLWRFWNAAFLQNFAGGAHSDVAAARDDKRFKDEVWPEMPYYDLLKQTYLLGSRQLHEFVDRAQVDDKTTAWVLCQAVHRCDESVEFSRDQSRSGVGLERVLRTDWRHDEAHQAAECRDGYRARPMPAVALVTSAVPANKSPTRSYVPPMLLPTKLHFSFT